MPNMRFAVPAVLAGCLVAGHARAAADSLTLVTVWAEVDSANPDLAARRQMERAAEARIGQAGAWADPMVMVGALNVPTSLRFDMDPMTMKAVGLSQTIPVNGAKGLEQRAARASLNEERASTAGTRADRLADAYAAFANLWTARALRAVLDRRASTLERIEHIAETRVSSGTGGVEDALRARAERARLVEEATALDREEAAAAAELNALRGVDPHAPVGTLAQVPEPPLAPDAETWTANLTETVPALRALSSRAAAYDALGSARGRRAIPDLSVGIMYGVRGRLSDGTEQENMWSAQVSASLPIFSAGTGRSAAREMRALSQAASAERAATELRAARDLVALHAEARRARATADAYAASVLPLDARALEAALGGYASGSSDFLRGLDAALALYRDQTAWLRARQAYAAAISDALRWSGDPIRFGLPPINSQER